MASWLQKAKTEFTITMGDGKVYKPLSMNANKSDEFNFTEFNFRNEEGTLVARRLRMGTSYDLTMTFQGGNHLDTALAFQKSSWNTAPWIIQHPYYGKLKVQPITAVKYDNSNKRQATTTITVTVRETIAGPKVQQDPVSAIVSAQRETTGHYADYFVNAVPTPTVQDAQQMQGDVNKVQQILSKVSASANEITNAYNKANAGINTATTNVGGAINSIQYYLTLPATIAETSINRVNNLNNMMQVWFNQIATAINVDLKAIWFTEAGTIMGAMALASVTGLNATDYQYSNQVTGVIQTIIGAYNQYLSAIDRMQTPTGNTPTSWQADPTSIISLDNLMYLTLSTLFAYQANSKQAKYVTLSRDSNVILIAWEIYGLLTDDSTIDKVIADNNIGGNWLLQIPKGTQILYYA